MYIKSVRVAISSRTTALLFWWGGGAGGEVAGGEWKVWHPGVQAPFETGKPVAEFSPHPLSFSFPFFKNKLSREITSPRCGMPPVGIHFHRQSSH